MSMTTIASLVQDSLKSKILQATYDRHPLMKHAKVEVDLAHDGDHVIWPIIVPFDRSTSETAKGSNPTAHDIYTSGTRTRRVRFSDTAREITENLLEVNNTFWDRVTDETNRWAQNWVHDYLTRACRWGMPMIRLDFNPDYSGFFTSTTDGDATTIVTSTDLAGYPADTFLGGQACVVTGSGIGQARSIQDSTTSTLVSTTITGVEDTYCAALTYGTKASSGTVPISVTHASSLKNLGQSALLTSTALMTARFILKERFKAPTLTEDGSIDFRLFLTEYGWKQLCADPLFLSIMGNTGEFFKNTAAARNSWMGINIAMMDNGFRSTADGATTDAAYSATGVAHYFPMVGLDFMRVAHLSGQAGNMPGAINVNVFMEPDKSDPSNTYGYINATGYFGAQIPIGFRGVNLVGMSNES